MEINDKYTHILTHIQQESLSVCGGRVRRTEERRVGWGIDVDGGVWWLTGFSRSSVSPTSLPRQQLSSPSRNHSSRGSRSFRPAGAPGGGGTERKLERESESERGGHNMGHFRLISHDPSERRWLTRS